MHVNILNTRPEHQSQHLTKLLQQNGGHVFHLPLFEIQAISFQPIKMHDYDIVIFLSANAVNCFFDSNEKIPHHPIFIAIGPATQKALKKRGFSARLPHFFNSEGIADMPLLQSIQNKKIAIISGKNSKSFLPTVLKKRGAIITPLYCYQRCPIQHNMKITFAQLQENKISVVICTSMESLLQLMILFSDYSEWILSKTVCVINEAMQQFAIEKGFNKVIRAKNATDEAMVDAISEYTL